MSKKDCELCGKAARMFCESDEASLCWDCDEKVHAANFLVAKHSRTLLCHACHSPTPWKAAGLRLGQAFSVCRGCAEGGGENRGGAASGSLRGDEDDGGCSGLPESESDDGEFYGDSEGSSEEEEEEEEDEEGENQVVPWSDSGSNTPAAAAMASYSGRVENASLSFSKRTREIAFESEDDDICSSSEYPDVNSQFSDGNTGSSPSMLRSLKMRRRSNNGELLQSPPPAIEGAATSTSGTAAMVEKLRRLQQKSAAEGRARHVRGC